jgi:hypothetical protein
MSLLINGRPEAYLILREEAVKLNLNMIARVRHSQY